MLTASLVPRAPSIKSFCISTTTNIFIRHLSYSLLHISRKPGNAVNSRLQIFICGNIVCHLSIMELLISHHIEISGAGQAEDNGFLFSGFLTLHRLVYGHLDGVAALRRRQDAFYSGKCFAAWKTSTWPTDLASIYHLHTTETGWNSYHDI